MGRAILAYHRSAAQPAMAELGRNLSAATARPRLAIIGTADHLVGSEDMRGRSAARAGAQVARFERLGHWWMVQDAASQQRPWRRSGTWAQNTPSRADYTIAGGRVVRGGRGAGIIGGVDDGKLAAGGRAGPALIWHTFPLGLLGADQSGRDRTCLRSLRELIDWLPHVAGLGADVMLLGPVFASLSHGYDTVTHRAVDDRLGTLVDLDALVDAAAVRGIAVVLDGAFAYASRGFWRLADPAERDDPWFVHDDRGEHVAWRVDSLITPDYGSVGYRSYVAEVMTWWLDRGIAGWRLDSSWSVPADNANHIDVPAHGWVTHTT